MRPDRESHPRRQSASLLRKERRKWIPAFAGMTEEDIQCSPVIPLMSGIHEKR